MVKDVPYPNAPRFPELRTFISGSDRDQEEKGRVAEIIKRVNDYLINKDYEVRIVPWRTQASLILNKITKRQIIRILLDSQFFVGIAHSRFNAFTALEWRVALTRYTKSDCTRPLIERTVYYFNHNNIATVLRIQDDEELQKTGKPGRTERRFRIFLRRLRTSRRNGDIEYLQCRSYLTDSGISSENLDDILQNELYPQLLEWFFENYKPPKPTEPLSHPERVVPEGGF